MRTAQAQLRTCMICTSKSEPKGWAVRWKKRGRDRGRGPNKCSTFVIGVHMANKKWRWKCVQYPGRDSPAPRREDSPHCRAEDHNMPRPAHDCCRRQAACKCAGWHAQGMYTQWGVRVHCKDILVRCKRELHRRSTVLMQSREGCAGIHGREKGQRGALRPPPHACVVRNEAIILAGGGGEEAREGGGGGIGGQARQCNAGKGPYSGRGCVAK